MINGSLVKAHEASFQIVFGGDVNLCFVHCGCQLCIMLGPLVLSWYKTERAEDRAALLQASPIGSLVSDKIGQDAAVTMSWRQLVTAIDTLQFPCTAINCL